jgi:hypothetical protein
MKFQGCYKLRVHVENGKIRYDEPDNPDPRIDKPHERLERRRSSVEYLKRQMSAYLKNILRHRNMSRKRTKKKREKRTFSFIVTSVRGKSGKKRQRTRKVSSWQIWRQYWPFSYPRPPPMGKN